MGWKGCFSLRLPHCLQGKGGEYQIMIHFLPWSRSSFTTTSVNKLLNITHVGAEKLVSFFCTDSESTLSLARQGKSSPPRRGLSLLQRKPGAKLGAKPGPRKEDREGANSHGELYCSKEHLRICLFPLIHLSSPSLRSKQTYLGWILFPPSHKQFHSVLRIMPHFINVASLMPPLWCAHACNSRE